MCLHGRVKNGSQQSDVDVKKCRSCDIVQQWPIQQVLDRSRAMSAASRRRRQESAPPANLRTPCRRPARVSPARALAPARRRRLDPITIGRRLRHLRRAAGLTLDDAGGGAGLSPSALSLIENGKREPRLSMLHRARRRARQLGRPTCWPRRRRAGGRPWRSRWSASSGPDSFAALGIPAVRTGPRLPIEALEALVGLHRALADGARRAGGHPRARPPRQRRAAGADARAGQLLRRDRGAGRRPARQHRPPDAARSPGPASTGWPPTSASPCTTPRDLPSSTRSVTDLANRRIYLPQPEAGQHDSRSLALQALAHIVLGHRVPADYAEFLAQRVEINYFAAALLIPERGAVAMLRKAKAAKDIAIEDLRDAYAVSYETAAHRFTNLATHHLDIPVHFMRISAAGMIYKAYENDGVRFPTDATGAIEGQRVCRYWTRANRLRPARPFGRRTSSTPTPASGTYWCTSVVDRTPDGRSR